MAGTGKKPHGRDREPSIDQEFLAKLIRVLKGHDRKIRRLSQPSDSAALELFRQGDLERVIADTARQVASLLKDRHRTLFAPRRNRVA